MSPRLLEVVRERRVERGVLCLWRDLIVVEEVVVVFNPGKPRNKSLWLMLNVVIRRPWPCGCAHKCIRSC